MDPGARAAGTAGIVVIGDEILSGKTRDENAGFLIGELRSLGVSLRAIAVIPDVLDEIAATVRAFSARYEHVFTSGGVGPTHDDLTMEGVARAFGTRVVRHPRLEQLLRGYYARSGERLEERNLRMADVPEGVTLIESDELRWPVPCFDNVYILPGIPEIFRAKFSALGPRFRVAPFHLACLFTRDEEGAIAAHLDALAAAYPEVAIGSYPRVLPRGSDEWKVKVTFEAKDGAKVDRAAAELVERLGDESVVRVERTSARVRS